MDDFLIRTRSILGEEKLNKLTKSHVAIFGIGGVGGYVAESLARSGIKELTLIDNDIISISNINRQIYATHSTIGKLKTEVAKSRILDINPECKVHTDNSFILPGSHSIDFTKFDYVVDAIDTITGKLEIIHQSKNSHVPVISCMGTGNKIDASLFKISDISKTTVCPLAKVMRRLLKERGIDNLKVLYSEEQPITPTINIQNENGTKIVPGSISYAPAIAGLLISQQVITDLSNR